MFYFYQRFFFGGRLIFGPGVASLFLSMLLIAGPPLLFCFQISRKIQDSFKLHNHEGNDVNAHTHILGFPILFVTIILMLVVRINTWIYYEAVVPNQ